MNLLQLGAHDARFEVAAVAPPSHSWHSFISVNNMCVHYTCGFSFSAVAAAAAANKSGGGGGVGGGGGTKPVLFGTTYSIGRTYAQGVTNGPCTLCSIPKFHL